MCCIEQGGTANLMGRIVDGECLLSIFISFLFCYLLCIWFDHDGSEQQF